MANKPSNKEDIWTEIEVRRMEYFLLIVDNLQMHPSEFLAKWQGVKVRELAELLGVENCKIYHWCSRKKPNISKYYLLKIALIDLFFEHFDDIPDAIWKKLMS